MQQEDQLENVLQLSTVSRQQDETPERRLLAVEVPKVENSEEYEYLPGHFDVRYITRKKLDKDGEALYTVRLQSGEIQTVSSRSCNFDCITLKFLPLIDLYRFP